MLWETARRNIKNDLVSTIKDNEYQHYYRENYSNCVNWEVYRNVWKDIINEIVPEMMIYNYHWKLPCGMGSIAMRKYKPKIRLKEGVLDTKNLRIDYKETRILWENDEDAREKKLKVYHINDHTDNNKVIFQWIKPLERSNKIRKYRFYISRLWNRKLATILKEHLNKSDYFETYYGKRFANR